MARARESAADLIRGSAMLAWHGIASAIAVLLIATGWARRARRQAFSEGVISAIYFHKPDRRLVLRCVLWLMKNGYTFVSAGDVIEMCKGRKAVPRGAVWLSFDDGWREWIPNVLPVIRRWKIPVTLFIPSGIVEGDGMLPWLHQPEHPSYNSDAARRSASRNGLRETITVAELREIAQYPEVTVGSHTVTHPLTPYCSEERIQIEIGECKRKLESWIGKPVQCFAYPEGKYDGRERHFLIEFGYELAVTTQSGSITAGQDRYSLPRFSIGDDMPFPQAICSMVGIWRPLIDPVKEALKRGAGLWPRGKVRKIIPHESSSHHA